MIVLAGLLGGAGLGAWRAKRRRGSALDMAQWAAAHAIMLGLAGLLVTILIDRVV